MRIILILVLIAAVLVVVQSYRNECTFGEAGWWDCVLGRTATTETPAPATDTAPPATGTTPPPAGAPAQ